MLMRKAATLFFIFLAFATVVKAQKGNVVIVENPQVSTLVEKHKYLNDKQKIVGWRVQIFFDSGNNSKSRAFSKKGEFMTKYPDMPVYLMFQSPYYKVRVGDFRSRIDAEGFKQKIVGEFTDAFVVKDDINFPGF